MSKAKRRKIKKTSSKKNMKLKLVYEPIGKLEEWAKNPRINDEAAEKLCGLIETHGFINPIVASPDGIIRAGHTRVKSAKSLGYKELPVLYVPFESEEAAEMFAIADNKSSEWADWDRDLLNEFFSKAPKAKLPELEKISGFTPLEIEEIRGENEIIEDEVPEPPKKAVTRKEDLWLLGKHRVLCGDSTKEKDVKRLMKGKKADMVTDPPYGINYDYESHVDAPEDNNALVRDVFRHVGDVKIWTCGLMNLARELGHYPEAKVLAWHKGFAQAGNGLGGAGTWEPVLVVGVKGGTLPNNYLSFSTDREPGLREMHSCPKPVALYAHLIQHLTQIDLYDPLLGSGTTLIAAEQLDRICYGMEIDPIYVDVTILRWQQLTGKTPTLLRKGKKIKKSLLRKINNG